MRTIVLLLLLANLTLFAYTRLDRAGGGESARLAEQVQPDRIRLLTPQQVAALGPAKVAALPDVCLEWGPFSDAEKARALAELEPSGLGRLLTQKRVENSTAFWVFLPRSANRAAIDRRVAALAAAGVKDVAVVDTGAQRYTISLGVFRTEEAARARVADLARAGHRRRAGGTAAADPRPDAAGHPRSRGARRRARARAAAGVPGDRRPDRRLRQQGRLTPGGAGSDDRRTAPGRHAGRRRACPRAVRGVRRLARRRPLLPGLRAGAGDLAGRLRAAGRPAAARRRARHGVRLHRAAAAGRRARSWARFRARGSAR